MTIAAAAGIPPQRYARTAGWLYLAVIALGLFGEFFVSSLIVVSGNAEATAKNILDSESLFRAGAASEIFMLVCDIGVALLLYIVLKPVSQNLAALAALFRLIGDVVWGVGILDQLAALRYLKDTALHTAFTATQLQALASIALKGHDTSIWVATVFFAINGLLLGLLILRSGYMPKVIGGLLLVGSTCDFIGSCASVVAPSIAALLPDALAIPMFVAELSLALWLTVRGVRMHPRKLTDGRNAWN